MFKRKKSTEELRLEKIELTYKKHFNDFMQRLTSQFCLDEIVAEDIIQQTFERILKYCDDFETFDDKDAFHYSGTVMAHVAFDYIENNKNNPLVQYESLNEILENMPSPPMVDGPELLSTERYYLEYVVKKLPSKFAPLLIMYYQFGYSAKEIAKRLDSCENNVHQRLHYVRKKLRVILEKEDSDYGK